MSHSFRPPKFALPILLNLTGTRYWRFQIQNCFPSPQELISLLSAYLGHRVGIVGDKHDRHWHWHLCLVVLWGSLRTQLVSPVTQERQKLWDNSSDSEKVLMDIIHKWHETQGHKASKAKTSDAQPLLFFGASYWIIRMQGPMLSDICRTFVRYCWLSWTCVSFKNEKLGRYPDRSPNNICIVCRGQQGMILTIVIGKCHRCTCSLWPRCQSGVQRQYVYREGAYMFTSASTVVFR